jgi:saccharopine dehydrogenase-like NADP-dependent oxidoreductase
MMKGGFFDSNKIKVNGAEISPLEFTSAVLKNQWKLGADEAEFTLMKIIVSGKQNSLPKSITYNLYDEYDAATQTSSMSRTTGYTCNATLHLIMNKLFTEKGVFPPELVGKDEACFRFVLSYLKERGVIYKVS